MPSSIKNAPSEKLLTKEQAAKIAISLRKHDVSFEDIAAVLAHLGYVNPRTSRPPGPLSVRHMVYIFGRKG